MRADLEPKERPMELGDTKRRKAEEVNIGLIVTRSVVGRAKLWS